MNRFMTIWLVAVGLFFATMAGAGTYYVNVGGTGAGSTWGDACGTIQAALNTIYNTGDSDATVYVGKTTGMPYGGADKTFTNGITLRILGGYDPATNLRDGTSSIEGSGYGFHLETTGGIVGDERNGHFTIAHFSVNTGNYGLYADNCPTATKWSFAASNCTITTSHATSSPIYLYANGKPMSDLALVGCIVTTRTDSVAAAIRTGGANGAPGAMVWLANCLVVAAADAPATEGRRGAVEAQLNRVIIEGCAVTNNGAGFGVYAGNVSYVKTNHFVLNSTVTSAGAGVQLDCRIFNNPTPSLIANSTIMAGDSYGLYTRGHGYDTSAFEVIVSNCTITVGGDGIGWNVEAYNGSRWDSAVFNSHIHGGKQALKMYNTSNPMHGSLFARQARFTAGAVDGGANSSSPVVTLDLGYGLEALFDRCHIMNGAAGIEFDTPGQKAYLYMVNSVITDQTGYGVRLVAGGNYSKLITATNCTFSALGGPCVVWGDSGNGTESLVGSFYMCAFAPGGSATVFESQDVNKGLVLNGLANGFYQYGTFAVGPDGYAPMDNITDSAREGGTAAGLDTDGWHLLRGAPLIDKYTVGATDPATDIDGDVRALGSTGDIGCDEAVFASNGTLILMQ